MKSIFFLLFISLVFSESSIKSFRHTFFQFKRKESGYKHVKLFEATPEKGIIPLQYIYFKSESDDDKNRLLLLLKQ